MIDQQKVHDTIINTGKSLLAAGLTGEEYLIVLRTLVAHVIVANDVKVKRMFFEDLNADIRTRRIAMLKAHQEGRQLSAAET